MSYDLSFPVAHKYSHEGIIHYRRRKTFQMEIAQRNIKQASPDPSQYRSIVTIFVAAVAPAA